MSERTRAELDGRDMTSVEGGGSARRIALPTETFVEQSRRAS